MNIQTITNVSDCVPLYLPHSLYLKPLAKFNVSVSLPSNKLGKTIKNNEIREKLIQAIQPDKFLVLKVSKITLDFIRFEAEIEDRTKLKNVLARLDGRPIKISDFSDSFKVRASEAKDDFPNRHDWDSFFRDARNMDEMKAGERPDTIHISCLPIRWFCPRHLENENNVKPSENIFRRIFEKFGSVRCVDIPICDPYRSHMKTEITGMKTFSFDQEVMFEGYVQFNEYVGFVKAMDEFRGMKLIRKFGDKNQATNISVTFDKTKHLSEASIKRRTIVRDRLISKEKAKIEEENRKKKEEQEKLENERKKQEELKQKELEKQREREQKRKEKHLKKLQEKGQLEITNKIRIEEKKLLIAQRKLESIRILESLFERLKVKENQIIQIKKEGTKSKIKVAVGQKKGKNLGENDLRNKLVKKVKCAQEQVLKKQKTKLERVKGKTGLGALIDKNKKDDRSPSVNTISSDDSVLSDSHLTDDNKKKKIKKKKKSVNATSSSSSSSSSSNDGENESKKKSDNPKNPILNPFGALYNSELAAEWMQMGMYPYPTAMFPGMAAIRPGFFPNALQYRGSFPYRGRFPRRGRGQRNRGGQYGSGGGVYPYDNDQYYKYFKRTAGGSNEGEEYFEDYHDRRRSKSYSSSRSRSRSRTRSRSRRRSRSRYSRSRRSRSKSRSRSRSRTRRSRSKSRSHSRSRTRSRRRSHSKSRSRSKVKTKLVSTRRSKSSSSGWSRSRSRSRSRSWSRNHHSSNENHKNSGQVVLQPEKLVRTAKEIQRSVQKELHDRMIAEEEKQEKQRRARINNPFSVKKDIAEASTSRKRSNSVDSSKFISPKRKEKSTTPEKEWK